VRRFLKLLLINIIIFNSNIILINNDNYNNKQNMIIEYRIDMIDCKFYMSWPCSNLYENWLWMQFF